MLTIPPYMDRVIGGMEPSVSDPLAYGQVAAILLLAALVARAVLRGYGHGIPQLHMIRTLDSMILPLLAVYAIILFYRLQLSL